MKTKDFMIMENKRGAIGVDGAIDIFLVLILVGALAPTALVSLFNTTLFTGVPTWVVTTLGIVGAIAFILLIVRVAKGTKGK